MFDSPVRCLSVCWSLAAHSWMAGELKREREKEVVSVVRWSQRASLTQTIRLYGVQQFEVKKKRVTRLPWTCHGVSCQSGSLSYSCE